MGGEGKGATSSELSLSGSLAKHKRVNVLKFQDCPPAWPPFPTMNGSFAKRWNASRTHRTCQRTAYLLLVRNTEQ